LDQDAFVMIKPRDTSNKRHKVPITPKQVIMLNLIGLIVGIVIVLISNLFFYVPLKKACIWFTLGVFFVFAFPWACLKKETKNRSVRAHNCFVIFAVILFVVVMIAQWGTEHQPFPVWAIAILILGGCIAYSVMAYYALQNFVKWCKGELEENKMTPYYRLVVKKPIELLDVLLCIFKEQAKISFEGDLSSCSFEEIPGTRTQPVEPLVRSTIYPKQDFVIIPIMASTLEIIRKKVLPQVGLRKNVLHVLISKNDKLVFWAYDCFDQDCVGLSLSVPENQVMALCEKGILKEYKIVEK
jgi:hypothetical protein